MNQLTAQQKELRTSIQRINFYMTGGSRIVYLSRNIMSALIAIIWLIIWLTS